MSNVQTLKIFIKANQERFLFGIILILVIIISFRAGELKEREQKSSEIKVIINNQEPPTTEETEALALGKAVQRKGLTEAVKKQESASKDEQCQYVGSKNSDKYHLMSCRFAEQIKPENRVCFKSLEEAVTMGYKPASCCNK